MTAIIKVDMRNAFNLVSRETRLSECSKKFPELLPWAAWCYMVYLHRTASSICTPLIPNKGPAELQNTCISTPLKAEEWENALVGHPDEDLVAYILPQEGFWDASTLEPTYCQPWTTMRSRQPILRRSVHRVT